MISNVFTCNVKFMSVFDVLSKRRLSLSLLFSLSQSLLSLSLALSIALPLSLILSFLHGISCLSYHLLKDYILYTISTLLPVVRRVKRTLGKGPEETSCSISNGGKVRQITTTCIALSPLRCAAHC